MAIKVRRGHLYPPIELSEGLALGLDDGEWDRIVDRLGRSPNHFECKIFAALWSEEVSNKSTAALLKTIEREYPNVKTATGSPLGLVKLANGQHLALRIVNNNKQAEIDAFYGAQTAIDGALEELASVGARPQALLNLFRFGYHDLIKSQKLFQQAAEGSSLFNNRVGIPLIGGDLYFHERYNASPMINSAVVGLVDSENALSPDQVPIGSAVLYVGAKTGRDGLRHAGEVQGPLVDKSGRNRLLRMGDPLLSNRILSACAEAIELGILKELVAVDKGGLAVACFDLSQRIKRPILLDIDRIPLREEITDPIDIILSESSERVLMITNRENHRDLNQILYKWDLESVKVGDVNDSDGIEFYWNHYMAADIPFQFALDGSSKKTFDVVQFPPMLKRNAKADDANKIRQNKRKVVDEWTLVREVALANDNKDEEKELDCPRNLEDVWLDLLANPNLCSRAPLYQMFDQVVGANTIVRPGGDASVLRLRASEGAEKTGLAVTLDCNSLYVMMEPYLGTVQTIAEGMRNLAAVGARPIGISACMNFGNPDNYREVCDLSEAIRGLGDASRIWNIPILHKEICLGNGREGNPCMPTPSILMAGQINELDKACTIGFKNKGDYVFLLGLTKNEIYCTEYSNYFHKYVSKLVPDISFEKEKNICNFIVTLIEQGLLNSCHDLSGGGLAVALTECCMARPKPIGATFEIEPQEFDSPHGPVPLRSDAALFSESSGRFLISCGKENEEQILRLCHEQNIPLTGFGRVGGSTVKITGAVEAELPLSTTYKLWSYRLEYLLGHMEKEAALA